MMDALLRPVSATINTHFQSKQPSQIVAITATTVLVSIWFYQFLFRDESIDQRLKRAFFKYIRLIPSIRAKIDKEMSDVRNTLMQEVADRTNHLQYVVSLPEENFTKDRIISMIEANLNLTTHKWREGRVSGAVYHANPELYALVKEIYGKTSYTNPLHADVFPGICKMEAEVVQMGLDIFHGDQHACGTMTSGGSESILMACKAYRDYAHATKGITHPEMVIPVTAHAAFEKAASYFKIRIRHIAINPQTAQVDLAAMQSAIGRNTIMLVGSAPNFPYGTIDDIVAIGQLGVKYNVPVHVDGCLGGFLTAFMSEAGYPVAPCDFYVNGVTSISADTHKYGFTPKGSSLILYREKKYLHYQYTVSTDWPGGVYGSQTMNGSRAGGSIAVCWATMLFFGKQGYVEATRNIIHTARYIEKGLRKMAEIYVFGQPATSVIAFGSHVFDIYRLSSGLAKLGWNLNALQFPSGIHICVTHVHTQPGIADHFIRDVKLCIKEIMADPQQPVKGKMAIYGTAQSLPDRSIVSEFIKYYLDSMYYIPQQNK